MTQVAPRLLRRIHVDVEPPARGRRARALGQRLAFALLRVLAGRRIVRGTVPRGPVLLAANHASHLDVLAVLRALPRDVRTRTGVAAAEDYFFRGRVLPRVVRWFVAVFPFPRRGSDGLARAHLLLARGDAVLLFPEGTRSRTGEIAPFRPGVGVLATEGATVVPVGIAGTREAYPKGARLPRRSSIAVVFGDSLVARPSEPPVSVAARVERSVRAAAASAQILRRPAKPPMFERARRVARSPRARLVAFCLAFAEAIAWPIVPDVTVALAALAAPVAGIGIALAAAAGSVAGGLAAYALGAVAPGLAHAVPAVTDRMTGQAVEWLRAEGADAVARQPWSGIPYKTFALQAADAGASAGAFAWQTLLARGGRMLQVAAVFGVAGAIARPLVRRFYGVFVAGFWVCFVLLWWRVLHAWQ